MFEVEQPADCIQVHGTPIGERGVALIRGAHRIRVLPLTGDRLALFEMWPGSRGWRFVDTHKGSDRALGAARTRLQQEEERRIRPSSLAVELGEQLEMLLGAAAPEVAERATGVAIAIGDLRLHLEVDGETQDYVVEEERAGGPRTAIATFSARRRAFDAVARRVVGELLPNHLAPDRSPKVSTIDGVAVPAVLDLGSQWTAPHHNGGWAYVLEGLEAFAGPRDGGVTFDGFVERSMQRHGVVRRKPWVGVLHYPSSMLEPLLASPVWRMSLPTCAGLFCLSRELRDWLSERVEVPVEHLVHPTPPPRSTFSWESFEENEDALLVQLGWWKRRPESLARLELRTLTPALVSPPHFLSEPYDALVLPGVRRLPYLSADDYDEMLTRNIGFLHLSAAVANNALVECIVRHTPVLVNPLPAVVEHLGEGYPLYFESLEEAQQKADARDLVRAAHDYLKDLPKEPFDRDFFVRSLVTTRTYRSLLPASFALLSHGEESGKRLLAALDHHPHVFAGGDPLAGAPTRETGVTTPSSVPAERVDRALRRTLRRANGLRLDVDRLDAKCLSRVGEACQAVIYLRAEGARSTPVEELLRALGPRALVANENDLLAAENATAADQVMELLSFLGATRLGEQSPARARIRECLGRGSSAEPAGGDRA